MKRNDFLDVIKGVCILIVIHAHFRWTDAERLKYFFPYWSNPVVPIFMIISGYVYAESYKRRSVTTFREAYDIKQIINKIIRYTVPIVLICMVWIYAEIMIFHKIPDVGSVVMSMFCGSNKYGGYYYPCMIQFIFLFPLIYLAISKADFKGLLLCVMADAFYQISKVPLEMSREVFRLLVFRYIFAISLGCYFSMGRKQLKKWMGIASFIFGAVFIYVDCYCGYKTVYFGYWSKTSMLAVFYIAPIVYLLIKKGKWMGRPLIILGKASYNIFLVQMVFFCLLDKWIAGVPPTFYPMLYSYAICIFVGLVFYQIEKPITKKIISWNEKIFKKIYDIKDDKGV